MDTAMNAYLLHHFDAADKQEQQLFRELLEEQDPDIMVWLNEPDTSTRYDAIIRRIRQTLTADT